MSRSKNNPPSYIPPASITGRRNRFRLFWREIEIPLLILLGLFSACLGVIGFERYFTLLGEPHNFGTSLYASLELLEFKGGNIPTPIPWELEVARWLSPAVTMYAVLLGLVKVFRNQLQLVRLRITAGHVVICGLGQKGLLLAKTFHASGQTVAVIENDGNNPFLPVCRDLGIIVLPGNARDEFILSKAGVKRAKSLIAVCGDDGTNADIAAKAHGLVSKRSGRKLECAIHINDPQLWLFMRQQELYASQNEVFRLDIFNIYDNGARQLLRQYPLLSKRNGVQEKSPHLIIVGLGNLGEQIVLHATRQWYPHYAKKGGKLTFSVIDPDARRKVAVLCRKYSLVEKICDWDIHPIDLHSPEFHQAKFLHPKHGELDATYIYVCIEDETIGLSSAFSLLKQTRATGAQILVRMTEDVGLAGLLHATADPLDNFARLHVFGLMERACQPSLLNDGSHEALARAIHDAYIRNELRKGNTPETNSSMVEWERLDEELQDMNRYQADDIAIKLSSISCGIVPWSEYGADQFVFEPGEIERMAKIEHERWCKQKLEQGWKYGPMRDDIRRIHPSLLGWDDLRFNEEEKDKDRNTVRQIPGYLALAGFQIFRISLISAG